MKKFTIQNGSKVYEYKIETLKAWDWSNLLTEILQCVASTEQFSAKNIIAAINTIAQTGADTSNAKQSEVKNVLEHLQSNSITFFYDVIRNALSNLEEHRRHKIFTLALSCVSFNNGIAEAGGLMTPLNLENIDMYILSPMDLLTLVKESLTVNYMPIFKNFFTSAPSTN